jgi:hypothetical protein
LGGNFKKLPVQNQFGLRMKLQAQENDPSRCDTRRRTTDMTRSAFPCGESFKTTSKGEIMCDSIASGFEFQPQPDGTMKIEFFDDDGKPLSSQVMTRECLLRIMLGAFVTTTVMGLGPEVARTLMRVMDAVEDIEDGLQ